MTKSGRSAELGLMSAEGKSSLLSLQSEVAVVKNFIAQNCGRVGVVFMYAFVGVSLLCVSLFGLCFVPLSFSFHSPPFF